MSRNDPSISDGNRLRRRDDRRGRWRQAAPILLLALVVAAFVFVRPDRTVGFEQLLAQRASLRDLVAAHGIAAIGLYCATFVSVAALAIPGNLVLTLAGGLLFGTVFGGLTAAFSATAGGTALFLAARTVLPEFSNGRTGRLVNLIRRGVQRGAWPYMLFLRLSPWIPFWLVNIAAASTGVPLRTFVWTTAFGILPLTFVVAAAGQNFDRIAAAGVATLEACRANGGTDCRISLPLGEILSPEAIAVLVGGSFLALAPKVLQALRSRMSPSDT